MMLRKGPFALRAAKRPPAIRIQLWRHSGRRYYASGEHVTKKAGSDLPWLITSIAVTVPTCAYLLQPSANKDHGHEHHGHGGAHKTDERKNATEDTVPRDEDEEEASEPSADAMAETSSSEDANEHANNPEKTDDVEGGASSTEGDDDETVEQSAAEETHEESEDDTGHKSNLPRFKGPTKDGPASDEKKHVPDESKGAAKKRIESGYGHRQGPDEPVDPEKSGSLKDQATSSKPPLDQNHQSGKQEGLSNTDTKHSYDLGEHPTIPHKGEGSPETAKVKGTVDPGRPQPEQREGGKGAD